MSEVSCLRNCSNFLRLVVVHHVSNTAHIFRCFCLLLVVLCCCCVDCRCCCCPSLLLCCCSSFLFGFCFVSCCWSFVVCWRDTNGTGRKDERRCASQWPQLSPTAGATSDRLHFSADPSRQIARLLSAPMPFCSDSALLSPPGEWRIALSIGRPVRADFDSSGQANPRQSEEIL